MNVKFLELYAQYTSIREEIDAAIASVIYESAFIGGKFTTEFEDSFASYLKADWCVGVGNGTDALEIALEALQLPDGSEVIVPANSFIASSEAVTRSGGRVVFCDCDPATYTVSVKDVERRITPRTKAIIAVHLYGQPCAMDELMSIAQRHDLRVIEDCAQAHGAAIHGLRVGTIGDVGTFSFYPGKNLGAYGDAGAIVTKDESLARKCRMIANHGRIGKYNHEFEGRNSRLDGLQAAILTVKLKHLEEWTERRIAIAKLYGQLLKGINGIELPQVLEGVRHVYHLYVIRTSKRDQLKAFLADRGVETGIHYPTALPKLPAYAYLRQEKETIFANLEDANLLSLPIGEHLSDEQVTYVADQLKSFLNN
jgi:dTDP-4-amino-4,6-dideoxygalactose transaminase